MLATAARACARLLPISIFLPVSFLLSLACGVWPDAAKPILAHAEPAVEPRLERALDLKRNGFYEEAIHILQALTRDAHKGDEAIKALAEAYEFLADWPNAAHCWRLYMVRSPSSDERTNAVFRYANALQETGQVASAAAMYRLFLRLRPDTHALAEALVRMGDCYAAAGVWREAADAYARALPELAPSAKRTDIILSLADALVLSGNKHEAVELFAREEDGVPDSDRPRYLYRWAVTQQVAAQEQEALRHLDQVFRDYPRSPYAHQSLVQLLRAGQQVDDYWRGLVDYYAGAYGPAIAAFERHIRDDPAQHRGSAHYYAGLSHRALGNYENAIREFDVLIQTHPGDAYIPKAFLAKAATLSKLGDDAGAITTYLQLAEAFPNEELATDGLMLCAETLERLGRLDEASNVYARVYLDRPASQQAPEAALRAGLIEFRQAAWSEAEQLFRVAQSLEKGTCKRCLYWIGRAMLARGAREEASAILQTVAASMPSDYYSYRAAALTGHDVSLWQRANKNLHLEANETEKAEADNWVKRFDDLGTWQAGTLPTTLTNASLFQAAQELLALGLRHESIEALLSLRQKLKHDIVADYALALWARDHELYRVSIVCASDIISSQADAKRSVPPFIWQLAYPTYYSDLVLEEASRLELDPLLFFALIRQESLFDPVIGSWAGAQGLAQIMPATGNWVADQLGEADFVERDLLRPHVSVRYGLWYLWQQYQYFRSDLFASLTAYNAGPGNVMRWLASADADPDLFYEAIAFDETKRYLDTILPNYYHYIRLYASGQ